MIFITKEGYGRGDRHPHPGAGKVSEFLGDGDVSETVIGSQ